MDNINTRISIGWVSIAIITMFLSISLVIEFGQNIRGLKGKCIRLNAR